MVVDGVGYVGVGMFAGAAQASASKECGSGLGAAAAHCGAVFSSYLSHSVFAADAFCLSMSGLGLVFLLFVACRLRAPPGRKNASCASRFDD